MSYRRTWIKRCAGALALAALSFLPGAGSAAPGGVAEFDVKSAYIYNFIQLVDWPARENGAAAGPIKIYVIGGASLGEALAGLKGREIEGRAIQVSSAAAANASLQDQHIVVLGRAAQDQLQDILKRLEGTDVLTVGDLPQFARKGGIIGFVTESGRVRIEINLRAAKRAGLKVSGKLMEVARVIQ